MNGVLSCSSSRQEIRDNLKLSAGEERTFVLQCLSLWHNDDLSRASLEISLEISLPAHQRVLFLAGVVSSELPASLLLRRALGPATASLLVIVLNRRLSEEPRHLRFVIIKMGKQDASVRNRRRRRPMTRSRRGVPFVGCRPKWAEAHATHFFFSHAQRSLFAGIIARAQTTEHGSPRRRLLRRRRERRPDEFALSIRRGQVRVNFRKNHDTYVLRTCVTCDGIRVQDVAGNIFKVRLYMLYLHILQNKLICYITVIIFREPNDIPCMLPRP